MDAPPPQEDVRPFVKIARHLTDLGFSAPRVLAVDEAQGFVLLEDLGDDTFTRLLARGEDEAALYRLATDVLISLHKLEPAKAILANLPPYDDDKLLAEAALLTDWYMPEALGRPTPDAVRKSYLEYWRDLLPLIRAVPDSMVLRDYHVDNLMILPGRSGVAACGLLDFQDAVVGPVTYDLMSLLEDARRDISPQAISENKERYLRAFPEIDPNAFAASFAALAAQRHCKVIGIFTRLYRRDGKPVYLRHIPRLWRLLAGNVAHPALAQIKEWLDKHIPPARRITPEAS